VSHDPRIKFYKPANYLTLGRNGYSFACGIAVTPIPLDQEAEVLFEPINSKGEIGRARLVVPLSSLAALRDALTEILTDKQKPAYCQGWQACCEGKDGRYANPYERRSPEAEAWDRGFLDAMEAEEGAQPEPEAAGY
jgi:hypothetical protein